MKSFIVVVLFVACAIAGPVQDLGGILDEKIEYVPKSTMAFVIAVEEAKAKFATTPIENELMNNYIRIISDFDHQMTTHPHNAIHAIALEEFAKLNHLFKKMKNHFVNYPALATFFKEHEIITRNFAEDLKSGAKDLGHLDKGFIRAYNEFKHIINTGHRVLDV